MQKAIGTARVTPTELFVFPGKSYLHLQNCLMVVKNGSKVARFALQTVIGEYGVFCKTGN